MVNTKAKAYGRLRMTITIEIPEYPGFAPEDDEILLEISHGIQTVLTLLSVDMSFQICFESGRFPTLPILNAYLANGNSDLLADRLEGQELYFKAVKKDGTETALSGHNLYDADIEQYQRLYNPLGGSIVWDDVVLDEHEYSTLLEILSQSGFDFTIDDFGIDEPSYSAWFFAALDYVRSA
ncbi:MAG: hypothetical protein K9L75_05605 [Spirochaetia bacterium]|nr:hypothetical protein [Spirochaetia bacterium]